MAQWRPGQTVAFGKMMVSGTMASASKFGSDLRGSHPTSMKTPLVDSPEIAPQLFSSSPATKDPAVKLVKNTLSARRAMIRTHRARIIPSQCFLCGTIREVNSALHVTIRAALSTGRSTI